jgi:hypothetical protein
MPRKRRVYSIKNELLAEARQCALNAIQTYNNPLAEFKSETFIVLMMIAWTYLLHAYYRGQNIEYRHYEQGAKRRRFERTQGGAYKYWQLSKCLSCENCPLEPAIKRNLEFLLGLRHEIEHHRSPILDDYLSGRYQACCVNFNDCIKNWFGGKWGIDDFLSYSIQFVKLTADQVEVNSAVLEDIPSNVCNYIARFDHELSDADLNSPQFAVRFLFTRKTVGKRAQADHVIEFLSPDSEPAQEINARYLIKETERRKYLPGQVVAKMQEEGFPGFGVQHHTRLWQRLDGKDSAKGYGAIVAEGTWYWYERWVDVVRDHCVQNREKYARP